MVRFQCPLCGGIIATETWEPGVSAECAYCGKRVNAPASRFAPGAVIGDFLMIRKLGEGGMGVVFLAHQLSLDRPAAIKVLNPEFSHETESVKAFIREARSAAKLNHPNIVQAYAVGEDEGLFYFAMEFIDGKTMKQVLAEKGKIPVREACQVIEQVAQALDCAWKEQKLVHHDIKPDNIMMCGNNRVKLADLGLSQVFGEDADNDSDEVLGTPQYISPEQLTGTVTDTRSDIYSLGATFYHLVTGRFPYPGENPDEIAKQHLVGTLEPPAAVDPLIPRQVSDIIVKMMARDPAQRYQNCEELGKALNDYLSGKLSGGLSGGLTGGLTGGLGGAKLSGGAADGPKLSGGLTGGLSAQPKILAPSSRKLSLTPKAEKSPEPKDAAAAPANAPAPAPAPAPAIKLKTASAATPPEGVSPAPAPAIKLKTASPAASVAAAQEAKEERKPEQPPAQNDAPAAAPLPSSEVADGAPKVPEAPKPIAVAGDADAAKEDETTAETPRSAAAVWIIFAVILLLLGGGGAAAWYFLDRAPRPVAPPAAEPPAPVAPSAPETPPPPPPPEPVETPAPPEPGPAPVAPPAPRLSPFEREFNRLNDMRMSDERSFLRAYPSASLQPANAAEREQLAMLERAYIECDEQYNVQPAREPLLKSYRAEIAKREADAAKRAQAAARAAAQAVVRQREQAETASFDRSDMDYKQTQPIRMERLDYAMVNAFKNNTPANWNAFKAAVKAAKNEPERVKDHPGRLAAAEELARYADQLDAAADQGQFILKELSGKSAELKGKTFAWNGNQVTILGAGRAFFDFQIKPPGKKARPQRRRVNFAKTNPDAADLQLTRAAERLLGRSDLYFYYLLCQGEIQEPPVRFAPSEFWKERAPQVVENYFRRALKLAIPDDIPALEKRFGKYPAFQRVKKNTVL